MLGAASGEGKVDASLAVTLCPRRLQAGVIRQGKPRQSLLYEFGERSRPYTLLSILMSKYAAQRQIEALMP